MQRYNFRRNYTRGSFTFRRLFKAENARLSGIPSDKHFLTYTITNYNYS